MRGVAPLSSHLEQLEAEARVEVSGAEHERGAAAPASVSFAPEDELAVGRGDMIARD